MIQRREPSFGYDPRQPELPRDVRAEQRPPVRKKPRHRGLLPMLVSGAAVIAFAAFLWMSYVRHPHTAVGGIPVIAADTTPVKVKPDQPGGMDIPFQDTTVYDELGQGKAHAASPTEHLLEPPEQPLPKPEAPAITPAAPAIESAAAPVQPPPATAPAVVPPVPVQPAPAEAASTAPAAPDAEDALAPPQPVPTPIPNPTPPAGSADLLLPPPPPAKPAAPQPAPSAAPVHAALAPPAPAPATIAAGAGMIQLGAFRDEATANGQWIALKAVHPDELAALGPVVERADLGAKGVWYRLKAGPLDPDEARQTCVALKAENVTCFVAK